jgi:hypothetical protein
MGISKNDSYEVMLEAVTRAAWKEFDRPPLIDDDGTVTDPGFDARVIGTFQNTVIIKDAHSETLYEVSYMLNGNSVVFGQPQEVAEMYVEKCMEDAGMEYKTAVKSTENSVEIGGPIVMKNAAQRIAYAPVLVPGEPDSDGEVLTAEKIEEVAHGWMESYRNVDLMHTLNNTGVPVESYILPMPMAVEAYGEKMELPVGTWVLASKLSPDAWAAVEAGVLTGYSVMGIKRAHLDMAMKSSDALDEAALKRTLLEDLGPDWVAAFVSVVDHPAVPKAKFFALKSKEFSMEDEIVDAVGKAAKGSPTFLEKIRRLAGVSKAEAPEDVDDDASKSESSVEFESSEKVGRKLSAHTVESLKRCKDAIKDAHDQLDAIICSADIQMLLGGQDMNTVDNQDNNPSDVQKSADADITDEGPVTDMDNEQLQAIISEAVKSAVEPYVNRLEALEAASKSDVVDETTDVSEVTEEPVAEKAAEDIEPASDEAAEKSEEASDVEDEIVEDAAEKAAEEAVVEVVDDTSEKSEDVVDELVVEKSEAPVITEEMLKAAVEEAAAKAAAEATQAAEESAASFKSEVEEQLEALQKRVGRVTVTSNVMKNDGGGSAVKETDSDSGRDAFGRRKR